MGSSNNKQQKQQQEQEPQDEILYPCDSVEFSNSSLSNKFATNTKKILPLPKSTTYFTRLGPKNYVKEEYKTKELCALIITINDNNSFDELYQTIEQTPPDPNQFVSVFQFSYSALIALHERLISGTLTDLNAKNHIKVQIEEVIEEIEKLDGENIVINFECCGTCNDDGFGQFTRKEILNLTKTFIKRKFVVMFSDFSVKALIKEWTENDPILGSNPFYKVGEFDFSHVLQFNAKKLIDCDFAQLQNVGELCEKGMAEVEAPGGTILYSIKKEFLAKDSSNLSPFDLNILTVVTSAENIQYQNSNDAISLIGEKGTEELKGLAGHVVLSYKNGGKILTSCGHWVELIQLDVTKESLLLHAERNYGRDYAMNLEKEINSLDCEEDRWEKIRVTSNNEVKKKAPCKYKSKSPNPSS